MGRSRVYYSNSTRANHPPPPKGATGKLPAVQATSQLRAYHRRPVEAQGKQSRPGHLLPVQLLHGWLQSSWHGVEPWCVEYAHCSAGQAVAARWEQSQELPPCHLDGSARTGWSLLPASSYHRECDLDHLLPICSRRLDQYVCPCRHSDQP